MSELHLVTGGSGYFGLLLIERLRQEGHRARIFDINDAEDRPPDAEFIRGDIRDAAAVRRACEGADVVHHNVALVPLAKDKEAFWSVNRDGTRILLEACREAGVRKVMHTSSSAVFGVPERNPVDETMTPHPREDYGRAKLAAEELCHEATGRGLDVTIIRPRTIMGHGRLGIMQIIFEWVRLGRNVPVFSGGTNVYQFVHADDLARAVIAAAERPGPAVYNVGAEKFGTMRETLQGLVDHAGTGSRVVSVPMAPAVLGMKVTSALGLSPLGPYHALMYGRSMYFDVSRIKKDTGWSARYDNVEMFCESYDWYLTHREEVMTRTGASHHRSPVRQGILDWVSRRL
jgi:nucleoside-diphosphate-sugar epimerase